MKLAIKMMMVCLAVLGLMLMAPGCSNQGSAGCASDADCGGLKCAAGACVQCTSDSHCNAADKCMICNGNSCVKKSNCCTADVQCGGGQRCWNVRGKAYGQCGPAN